MVLFNINVAICYFILCSSSLMTPHHHHTTTIAPDYIAIVETRIEHGFNYGEIKLILNY